jgi:flagellar biosynthesis repressor protein FlbT
MKNTLKITLKANEKIYVNGAVIKTDRKVSLEFLNDVQFLLQGHVLQPEDANTPLRQLYFIVQIMLMDPKARDEARALLRRSIPLLLASFSDDTILNALKHIDQLVSEDHVYEALKAIRALYPREAEILARGGNSEKIQFNLAAAE